MNYRVIALVGAAGVMCGGAFASGQPKEMAKPIAPVSAPAAPAKPVAPEQPKGADMAPAGKSNFSDPEMEAIAAALKGSWVCTNVPNAGSAGQAADVVMSVTPVMFRDMPNVMYAELAKGDALNRPYRQAIWQLHKVNGKLRLKTLEFRRPRAELLSVAGLWAAPDMFPVMSSEDVVTTLDIELTKVGDAWKGRTPHSYPTAMGGAVEMTTEMSISPTAFMTADTGTDADGKKVWGPEKAEGYTFKKFDAGVKVQRLDGGVVVVDFPAKTEGAVAGANDRVMAHYSMYLANGWMFDSSYERGSPWAYVPGRSIEGWKRAMADVKKGMLRKVVIPGTLGFGESGELRGKVPANATLYVDVQIMDVVVGGGAVPVGMAPGTAQFANPALGSTPAQVMDPNSPEMKQMQEKIRMKQEEAAKKKAAEGGQPVPAPKP